LNNFKKYSKFNIFPQYHAKAVASKSKKTKDKAHMFTVSEAMSISNSKHKNVSQATTVANVANLTAKKENK